VANDRQVYLACWGLFFGVMAQLSSMETRLLWRGAFALSIVFLLVNVARQLDYRDEITLWEATVREAPWNARAHNNLGFAYYEAGRKADARREMETALLLDPKLDKARANLAFLDWR
jgi:tetratricopeptide (TPR) repeat protein